MYLMGGVEVLGRQGLARRDQSAVLGQFGGAGGGNKDLQCMGQIVGKAAELRFVVLQGWPVG